MLTEAQYWILKRFPPAGGAASGKGPPHKLRALLGEEFLLRTKGKSVLDYGCGEGWESIELAQNGARKVVGLDIRIDVLEAASRNALRAGCQQICRFMQQTEEKFDLIVSIDGFEHFADPLAVLRIMERMLRPGGEVVVSFGPTWYHPLGGHLFSVFPWAHVIFSENALIRWRSAYRQDGATRFCEVAGGLNQMTIRRFEELVEQGPFKFHSLELVPIQPLRRFHNRLTREFTTSVVRCTLVKRKAEPLSRPTSA
jgi:SAM-dependent methyltransferase